MTKIVVVTKDDLGPEFDIGAIAPNKLSICRASQSQAGIAQFATPGQVGAGAGGVIVSPADLQGEISSLIGGAPTNLSTLGQLATALGNDPRFSTDIAAQLATKAPLDSPIFTGSPTAPTQPPGTANSTLSTTAFVSAAVQAGRVFPAMAAPLMNGVADPGAVPFYSRADHIHPSDTSRVPVTTSVNAGVGLTGGGALNGNITIGFDPAWGDGRYLTLTAAAAYAPLASPALTGAPTTPTPTQHSNNAQIASTAYVDTAVANVVGSAPEALDTLNELANALGDNPNFATTIATQIGAKANSSTLIVANEPITGGGSLAGPIAIGFDQNWSDAKYVPLARTISAGPGLAGGGALSTNIALSFDAAWGDARYLTQSAAAAYAPLTSPNFNGSPSAPTQPAGTNNNTLATTAFVASAVQAGVNGVGMPSPATSTPLADGVAATGTSTQYARADHVHPVGATTAIFDAFGALLGHISP